jgi:multicomponent Na+:H+ antiporter subunit E
MALANSLTLTPGTLTVGTAGSELLVHSLAPDPRDDLLDGGRERAIRYVFHGREENDVPGPRARGDAELVVGPETPSKSARDGNEREGETNGGTDGE